MGSDGDLTLFASRCMYRTQTFCSSLYAVKVLSLFRSQLINVGFAFRDVFFIFPPAQTLLVQFVTGTVSQAKRFLKESICMQFILFTFRWYKTCQHEASYFKAKSLPWKNVLACWWRNSLFLLNQSIRWHVKSHQALEPVIKILKLVDILTY
jgi:hypothetical protein